MGARGPSVNPAISEGAQASFTGTIEEAIKNSVDEWHNAENTLQSIAHEEDQYLMAGEAVSEALDRRMNTAIQLQSEAMEALLMQRSKSLMDALAKLNIWLANDLGSAADTSMMTLSERLACQAIRELNEITGFTAVLEQAEPEN